MGQRIQEWTKSNLWKTVFKKFEGVWYTLGRQYPFKFFKGCLPQILFGPLVNTLSQMKHWAKVFLQSWAFIKLFSRYWKLFE